MIREEEVFLLVEDGQWSSVWLSEAEARQSCESWNAYFDRREPDRHMYMVPGRLIYNPDPKRRHH